MIRVDPRKKQARPRRTSACQTARGTTVVPPAASYASRSSGAGDVRDAGDACGRIDTCSQSAGGRAVAGSNPGEGETDVSPPSPTEEPRA